MTGVRVIVAIVAAAWTASPGGCGGASPPPSPPPPPPVAKAPGWFRDVTVEAGLHFVHDAGIAGRHHLPEIMGSGAAFLDFDGDGDLDIYLVGGLGADRLYRREPDGTYRDVTEGSGLARSGFGMGVAVGDYDNDGDPDLYLTNLGPDALYRNESDGTFTDVTTAAGLADDQWACSAAFIDYDLDADLDLFVAHYVDFHEPRVCTNDAGRLEYCGPRSLPPTRNLLYRNDGDATFTDVSAESGIAAVTGRGLGVICDDFDRDGWPDIYVANDAEPNFLWINDRGRGFVESGVTSGTALSGFGLPQGSMGVCAGDVDADGDADLFVTNLVREGSTLYRNDGRGNFDDVTAVSGIGPTTLPLTGFGTAFLDVDHDGDLDLVSVNGRVKRDTRVAGADPDSSLADYAEGNVLLVNDGSGRFTDACDRAADLCRPGVSRGLAVGDADNDGDLDLLVTTCNGPARLLFNETPASDQGHWLIVRALEHRRDACGASVTVTAGVRKLARTVSTAYSYASSCDPRAHFGLGAADRYDAIEVRWTDGSVQRVAGGPADRLVTVQRDGGA